MVKNHYPELLEESAAWAERAKQVGQRTFELSQFLVDILGTEDMGAAYDGKITYHDSCHLLRGLGIREQPRRLIQHLKRAEFVEMKNPDRCCGFGGTFSVKYRTSPQPWWTKRSETSSIQGQIPSPAVTSAAS